MNEWARPILPFGVELRYMHDALRPIMHSANLSYSQLSFVWTVKKIGKWGGNPFVCIDKSKKG